MAMIFVYTNNLTIQWLRLGIVVSYDFETYQSVYIYEVIPKKIISIQKNSNLDSETSIRDVDLPSDQKNLSTKYSPIVLI